MAHCDLKPENVCVVSLSRRAFKIIDFGSAMLRYDHHNSSIQTLSYRAPEVWRDQIRPDQTRSGPIRSDPIRSDQIT